MGKRIVFVGVGAIGGHVGGHLARGGQDVTLIDPYPEHVDYIKRNGIDLSGLTDAEKFTVPVPALHVTEVQSLIKEKPVDIAFVCMKSYDTEWAATLIRPYLAESGFIVSLQNCLNEERVAGVVGWGRTVGCVASLISVELDRPGHVERLVPMGGNQHTVFRVGEVHGRITPRVEEIADMMQAVDSAKVTTNLWGERWSKLVVNVMRNGLAAATGKGGVWRDTNDHPRGVSVGLGAEAIRVGRALGYNLESIVGMEADTVVAAAEGDEAAKQSVKEFLGEQASRRNPNQRPSMGQDIAKGRRTEIDFINGLVVEKGKALGIPTPFNEALVGIVQRVERGKLKADPSNIDGM